MLRQKTRRWRIAQAQTIGYCALWGSPSLDSIHIGNKCSIWWRYKQPKHSNSSCNLKHPTPRRTSHTINDTMSSDWEPSTSRQWWNNKYMITCLQGEVVWTIVQGYSFKQVSSTRKRRKNSPWTIKKKKATKAVPVWLHQALGMGISKPKAKKAAYGEVTEEERKCLAAEAAGEGEKSDEGASTGSVVWMRDVSASWISAEMSDTDVPPHGC